jgi:hypothetical protein
LNLVQLFVCSAVVENTASVDEMLVDMVVHTVEGEFGFVALIYFLSHIPKDLPLTIAGDKMLNQPKILFLLGCCCQVQIAWFADCLGHLVWSHVVFITGLTEKKRRIFRTAVNSMENI